jgi:putative heme degradation protein
MEQFNFYKDEKCTIWNRGHFQIEAETYEEAVEKVKKMEEDLNLYNEVDVRWEDLPETLTDMDPSDNNYMSTVEIYSDDTNQMIFENGQPNK